MSSALLPSSSCFRIGTIRLHYGVRPLVSHEFEARVYDLDGTLVRLAVDWAAAASDVIAVYEDTGVEVDPDAGLWDLVGNASRHGIEDEVEAVLSEREIAGAEDSGRLPLADELESTHDPVGVCSLNCEAACRVALDTHDLTPHVDTVVGRDTVSTWKPDPAPLLHAVDGLGLSPENVLFVGDSERDAVTAERAGIDFQWVE